MKKIVAFAGLSLLAVGAFAQTNLQVFYDFGKDRKNITSTLEMFKADSWGSTFFFVDYDYSTGPRRDIEENGDKPYSGTYGAYNSYFEIARSINFWEDSSLGDLSAHVEFNAPLGYPTYNWLFGVEYLLHNGDYSNTFTIELLYKTFNTKFTESKLPLQLTFVWGMNNLFGIEGLKFSGFADIWGEKHNGWADQDKCDKSITFISEPQLWYNVGQFFNCPNFNIGAEVELSNNFALYNEFKCNPCIGVKWDF
jgi:hypothetical protein